MRTVTWLCVALLLGSLAWSGLRVRGAWEASRLEADRLSERADAARALMRELSPASREQIEGLRLQRETLAEQAGAARASLLDRAFSSPPPALAGLLENHPSPLLAVDAPFGARLRELAAAEPALERGFAALLAALEDAGQPRIEDLSFRTSGGLTPVPDTRGLQQLEFELVLLDQLPELLEAFESMIPGRGDPLIVIEHASLRRLEPSLWETLPPDLSSPPVRLWMHIAMVVGEARP
ncbi:MAG: hypothetical protein DHS20C15_21880 [Planctomycetota bacterium]|nr:MAG: hypothetical protein DHS20C15_21880 [Planctomycetota bacterium]